MFTYQGETKTYKQQTLVWAQVMQLSSIIEGITFEGSMTPQDLVKLLDKKLYPALAVVLREEGKLLREKDLKAFEEELMYELPITEVVKVVKDFFDCNPTASLLEEVVGTIKGIVPGVEQIPEAVSTESSSSSQVGT